MPALVVVDRALAVALVPERRADLAVQVADPREVLLARGGSRGTAPRPRPRGRRGPCAARRRPASRAIRARVVGSSRAGVESAVRSGRTPRGSSRATAAASPAASSDVERLASDSSASSSSGRGRPPRRGPRRGRSARRPAPTTPSARSPARSRDELADLDVLAAANRLGQHRVGDVADQDVLEGVLALAGEAAAGARDEQVLLLQRGRARRRRSMPSSSSVVRARPPRRSGRPPRRAGAAPLARASSESSRAASSDWTVLGQRVGLGGALLLEPVDHLLGEQRVAAGALGDLRHDLRAAAVLRGAAAAAPRPARGVSLAGQRLERDRGRVAAAAAPAGPPLEQLVAGQADEQQRRAHPARQVLDQVEHSLVGPVDVLDREHQRRARRRSPRRRRGRRRRAPRASAAGPRSAGSAPRAARCRAGGRAARRCARRPRTRRRVARSGPRRRAELLPGGLGVVGVDDLELVAEDLAERPVGDARRRRAGTARAGSSAARPGAPRDRTSARAAGATCRPRPGRSR